MIVRCPKWNLNDCLYWTVVLSGQLYPKREYNTNIRTLLMLFDEMFLDYHSIATEIFFFSLGMWVMLSNESKC